MKTKPSLIMMTLVVYSGLFGFGFCMGQMPQEAVSIPGLSQPVEIIKDVWGISHIYAQNQSDLFFGQGFNVALDRLFQLEMWRRQASGTMAQILGQKALTNDTAVRNFLDNRTKAYSVKVLVNALQLA